MYRPSPRFAGSASLITSLAPCGAGNATGVAEPANNRSSSGLTGSVKRSSIVAGGAASAAPSAGIEATSPA